jgi:redox-sensitive bicupin YhaK (pirin superfamily)
VTVNQDVSLFASILESGESVDYSVDPKRYGWLQVARGSVEVNGEQASHGDGVVVVAESALSIRALEPSELLLFDLA